MIDLCISLLKWRERFESSARVQQLVTLEARWIVASCSAIHVVCRNKAPGIVGYARRHHRRR